MNELLISKQPHHPVSLAPLPLSSGLVRPSIHRTLQSVKPLPINKFWYLHNLPLLQLNSVFTEEEECANNCIMCLQKARHFFVFLGSHKQRRKGECILDINNSHNYANSELCVFVCCCCRRLISLLILLLNHKTKVQNCNLFILLIHAIVLGDSITLRGWEWEQDSPSISISLSLSEILSWFNKFIHSFMLPILIRIWGVVEEQDCLLHFSHSPAIINGLRKLPVTQSVNYQFPSPIIGVLLNSTQFPLYWNSFP